MTWGGGSFIGAKPFIAWLRERSNYAHPGLHFTGSWDTFLLSPQFGGSNGDNLSDLLSQTSTSEHCVSSTTVTTLIC